MVVGALVIVATIFERSLTKRNRANAVHPTMLHAKQMLSFEQTNVTDDDTNAMKLNKIHANNILNGCTFELHPVSIENENNGCVQSPPKPPPMPPSLPASPSHVLLAKNQRNNLNGDGPSPLNGNGNGINGTNARHHANGNGNNNNNNSHNNNNNNIQIQQQNQNNVINRKNYDNHISSGPSSGISNNDTIENAVLDTTNVGEWRIHSELIKIALVSERRESGRRRRRRSSCWREPETETDWMHFRLSQQRHSFNSMEFVSFVSLETEMTEWKIHLLSVLLSSGAERACIEMPSDNNFAMAKTLLKAANAKRLLTKYSPKLLRERISVSLVRSRATTWSFDSKKKIGKLFHSLFPISFIHVVSTTTYPHWQSGPFGIPIAPGDCSKWTLPSPRHKLLQLILSFDGYFNSSIHRFTRKMRISRLLRVPSFNLFDWWRSA